MLSLRRSPAVIAAIVLATAAALLAPAAAPASTAEAAAKARCGSLPYGSELRLYVTRFGRVSCRRARRLVRAFRITQEGVQHGDGTLSDTYWTFARFPGWRCGNAAGGGGCRYRQTSRRVFFEVR